MNKQLQRVDFSGIVTSCIAACRTGSIKMGSFRAGSNKTGSIKTGSFRKERLCIATLALAALFSAGLVELAAAQPSPSALADRLESDYADRIRNINEIEITTIMSGGMFEGTETTTRYVKEVREGRPVLVTDPGDDGVFQAVADDIFADMVRHSASVAEESLDGRRVYRVEIDDEEYLAEIQTSQMLDEEIDEEFLMDAATLYIDRDDLLLRQMSFNHNGADGQALTIHFVMDEYQTYSGFPVPHRMRLNIEGLDQMISDDELAEMRSAMQEMEAQLSSMPQAQREMIERQLRPQMERFEAMMEQGGLGEMEVRVTDVRVN